MIQQIYWQRSLKIQHYIKVGCLFIVNEDYSLDTRLLFPNTHTIFTIGERWWERIEVRYPGYEEYYLKVFLNGSNLVAHEWKYFIEMSVVLAQTKICEDVFRMQSAVLILFLKNELWSSTYSSLFWKFDMLFLKKLSYI